MARSRKFASGKFSKAMDDRSGMKINYKDLRTEWTGVRVHKDDYEAKHPQLRPRSASDAQMLQAPRPDQDLVTTFVKGMGFLGVQAQFAIAGGSEEYYGKMPAGAGVTMDAVTATAGTAIGVAYAFLTGVEATFAAGDIGAGPGITGQAATFAVGDEVPTVMVMQAGIAINSSVGDEVPTGALIATNVMTSAVGTVSIDIGGWGNDAWGGGPWGDAQ